MRNKIIISLIILLVVGVLSTIFINLYMVVSTKKMILNIDDVKDLNNIDAILVLGCKAYSDRPSEMLEMRLLKSLEVYNVLGTKLLLSGDHGRINYDEVNIMKDYLVSMGIVEKDIFLDHAGFSTYDSIYRAKYVFNARKIVIVTQKYHLPRALYLAKCLGIDAVGICADDIPYKGIMLKNEIREILSRDKNFFKGIIKPKSKYVGDVISLKGDGSITNG